MSKEDLKSSTQSSGKPAKTSAPTQTLDSDISRSSCKKGAELYTLGETTCTHATHLQQQTDYFRHATQVLRGLRWPRYGDSALRRLPFLCRLGVTVTVSIRRYILLRKLGDTSCSARC